MTKYRSILKKKGIVIATAVLLVAGLVPAFWQSADAAGSSDRQKQINNELNQLKGDLSEASGDEAALIGRLNEIKAHKADLEHQVSDLQVKMNETQRRIDAANANLIQNQAEVDQALASLKATEEALAVNTKIMQRRAVDAYIGNDPSDSLSNIAFRSEDMRQITAASEYLHQIVRNRRAIVEEHRKLQAQAEATKKELEKKQEELKANLASIEAEKAGLESKKGELDGLKAGVDLEAKKQSDLIAEAQDKRAEIEGQMSDLQAQSNAIAAQLRAAAAQAAAAAAANSKKGSSGSGGSASVAPKISGGSSGGGGSSSKSNGKFANPVPGAPMTSPFGYRIHPIFGTSILHAGQDYGAAMGTPIHAAADGVVATAGSVGGYGNYTCIAHSGNIATCYGHQSQIKVSVGQQVSRGQVIGLVGSTGNSTGAHLHFEVRIDGNPVNPVGYI